MDLSFTIPWVFLDSIVAELRRRPDHVALGPAGLSFHTSRDIEILARSFELVHESSVRTTSVDSPARFFVRLSPFSLDRPHVWQALTVVERRLGGSTATPTCSVLLGDGRDRGLFTGLVSGLGEFHPLSFMRVAGPYASRAEAVDFAGHRERTRTGHDDERWSRLIGAFGGEAAWLRWKAVRACVIGAGRTGSLVAKSLAQSGVGELILIDPDVLEPHNLDAMDGVTERDVGRLKVRAIVDNLRSATSQLIPVPHPVQSAEARARVKSADIVISCVDSDSIRLVVASLASAYVKPLLDVGTGVFSSPTGRGDAAMFSPAGSFAAAERELGADIRLVLPGDGCLLCYGGVASLADALRGLRVGREVAPWTQTRAGSLRSLNAIAAHAGIRMIEDLVGGHLTRSLWLRYETSRTAEPRLRSMESTILHDCPMCEMLGMGDLLDPAPEARLASRTQPHPPSRLDR